MRVRLDLEPRRLRRAPSIHAKPAVVRGEPRDDTNTNGEASLSRYRRQRLRSSSPWIGSVLGVPFFRRARVGPRRESPLGPSGGRRVQRSEARAGTPSGSSSRRDDRTHCCERPRSACRPRRAFGACGRGRRCSLGRRSAAVRTAFARWSNARSPIALTGAELPAIPHFLMHVLPMALTAHASVPAMRLKHVKRHRWGKSQPCFRDEPPVISQFLVQEFHRLGVTLQGWMCRPPGCALFSEEGRPAVSAVRWQYRVPSRERTQLNRDVEGLKPWSP
jgi:hypothetical protein